MRRLLSWLHGRLQLPFPASKLRVLLAIWFVFLIVETQYFWSELPFKIYEFISYWFKKSLTNQRKGNDDNLSPSPKAVQVC